MPEASLKERLIKAGLIGGVGTALITLTLISQPEHREYIPYYETKTHTEKIRKHYILTKDENKLTITVDNGLFYHKIVSDDGDLIPDSTFKQRDLGKGLEVIRSEPSEGDKELFKKTLESSKYYKKYKEEIKK